MLSDIILILFVTGIIVIVVKLSNRTPKPPKHPPKRTSGYKPDAGTGLGGMAAFSAEVSSESSGGGGGGE